MLFHLLFLSLQILFRNILNLIVTSKCGLWPRSAVEMYVTMDSAVGSLLPRFRGYRFNFIRSPYRIRKMCENVVVEKYSYV